MCETFHAFIQSHESAEVRQFDDFDLDILTDPIPLARAIPGIRLELFQTERNSLLVGIDIQDFGDHFVALLQDLLRMRDLLRPREIRNVDHPVDALRQTDKRTEVGQPRDLALDRRTDWVVGLRHRPGIGGRLTDRKRDTAPIAVDAQDFDADVVANLQLLRRMPQAARPRDFRNMNKTLNALFQLNENTVFHEASDLAVNDASGWIVVIHSRPRIGSFLFETQ